MKNKYTRTRNWWRLYANDDIDFLPWSSFWRLYFLERNEILSQDMTSYETFGPLAADPLITKSITCKKMKQKYCDSRLRNMNSHIERKQDEIWLSPITKEPIYQQKCQKDKLTTQTKPQKSSITQRLRTDWGRSDVNTTATELVWLSGLRAQPSHSPCNEKDTHLKNCK